MCDDSLLSLSQLLHLEGFGFCRSLHCGDELLVCTVDFLFLNCDLLLPLHHLNFNLLQTDLLLLFGSLQLIRQLSFCFLERQEVVVYILVFNCWKYIRSSLFNSLPLCSLPG